MNMIRAFITASESVTESVAESYPLSAEDVAFIVGIALCVLFGFFLSFFILTKIKRK